MGPLVYFFYHLLVILQMFDHHTSHLFDQNIDRLLQSIENIFSANTLIVILDLPFILVFLFVIFLIHSTIGAITLFIILCVMLISLFMSMIANHVVLHTALEQKKEGNIIQKIISQHSTIKLFNYELIFEKVWAQIIDVLLPLKKKMQARLHLSTSTMQTVIGLTTVAIIGVGATLVVVGELGVGGLIAANILAARALSPLIKYISLKPNLQRGLQQLNELQNLTNVAEDRIKGSVIEKFKGKVTIEKLEFKYPEQKISLFRNISVSVSPGNILVITGNNGTGKTTLAKLLLGILEPNYGSISADEVLINQLQEPWWRQNVMYLPQEAQFIDGSFKINIFGQKVSAKPLEVNNVLIESGLKEFIDDQQNGIDAMLSSSAAELSPGIRKKVAIARALASRGQVIIFDEPTETLDQLGRAQVYKLINKLHKEKKTIIICSTDPYVIKGASAILQLNPKTGASIFTPKQLEKYQQNVMQKRKNFFKERVEAQKLKAQDIKVNKKKLN